MPASTQRRAPSAPRTPARPQSRPGGNGQARVAGKPPEKEHEILFQDYFKSANPHRTYAAQLKKANNGNHFLVLTEGKRDESTGEVRKTRLFLYSEDFIPFFKLLQATAQFIRANPVPKDVAARRQRFWQKKGDDGDATPKGSPPVAPAQPRAVKAAGRQ